MKFLNRFTRHKHCHSCFTFGVCRKCGQLKYFAKKNMTFWTTQFDHMKCCWNTKKKSDPYAKDIHTKQVKDYRVGWVKKDNYKWPNI